MTNLMGEGIAAAEAARPDPEALAAHLVAGGSPFDFVEPPDWFSYSTFDAFERCPRQYAFRSLKKSCRRLPPGRMTALKLMPP